MQERTLPRIDRVLAIAGRDDRTGDIILKVVNSCSEPQTMTLAWKGVSRLGPAGSVTVLTSVNPLDENSFDEPTKIAPRTTPLKVSGPSVTHSFAANSLSIIRVNTR